MLFILTAGISAVGNDFCLNVKGTIKYDRVSVEQVSIEINKSGTNDTLIFTDVRGKFNVDLEKNSEYEFIVSKDGYYSQKIFFNTQLDNIEDYTWGYKFIVDLIPSVNSSYSRLFDEPLGHIKYNSYTDCFENELNPLIATKYEEFFSNYEDEKDSTFDKVISEADSAFANKKYDLATQLYAKATILDSYSNYPDIQMDMIESIKIQDARIQFRYDKNIEQADDYYAIKKFDKAKKLYCKAYKLKAEEYPKIQMSKIKKIVSLKDVIAAH